MMKRSLGLVMAALLITACGDAADEASATKDAAVGSAAVESAAVETATDTTAGALAAEAGTWGDIVYGDPKAPVEIIEYASLTCPHCAAFAAQVFPTIKEKYIDTGKARLHYRNFVMNRVDLAASTVARCGNAETTRTLMKAFFEKQNEWARAADEASILDGLARIARNAGIARTEFDRCLANTDMHRHLVEMTQQGQKLHDIAATPTVLVNGVKVENNRLETVEAAIEAAL